MDAVTDEPKNPLVVTLHPEAGRQVCYHGCEEYGAVVTGEAPWLEGIADLLGYEAEAGNYHEFVACHRGLAALLYHKVGREAATAIMLEIAHHGGLKDLNCYAFGVPEPWAAWELTGKELPIDPVPAIEEQLRLAKIARAQAVAADIAADNAAVLFPILHAILPRLKPHPDVQAVSDTLTRIRTLCREEEFADDSPFVTTKEFAREVLSIMVAEAN